MVFSQIRTSHRNREIVAELTRKFNLGAENIIARIAIGYSLRSGVKFAPTDVRDSGGKEYSRNVLFGNYYSIYEALICTYYQINCNDKDLPRYFKMHLDDGLQRIYDDIKDNPNLVGYDYLFDKIQSGLDYICQEKI
ncbi:DNA sulfur modification protein DndE [Parabacteroides sp. PFB2-10]|uniref:DndE family protein n=1 Tax=Parabacteroides sp. PFB2-10 TaxID=1742405 RepID=UPI002472EC52|nr:DndE family protein [Parabacteroides sp. PFB2-10]MDH6312999.1 DNA sulfur modification protein DndE [Parabacteroides sp. PFB2-10]